MTLEASYGDYLIIGRTTDLYGRATGHETLGFVSPDGARYRVRVRLHGYSGDALAVDAARGGVRLRWGAPVATPGDVLRPVLPSELELLLMDGPQWGGPGLFGSLAGRPDGYVQAVVEEADDAANPTAWACVWGPGYLVQDSFRDTPSELAAVSLRFHDGLRFLDGRPAFGDASSYPFVLDEDVEATLRRCLGPLGGAPHASNVGEGWEGLVTANAWHPFLPTPIGATTDPLSALETDPEAWLDEDGASASMLDVVRALCARFGLRLHQSGGVWWLMQRDLVAADPTAVPTWAYARTTNLAQFGLSATSTHTAEADLTEDVSGWVQRRRPEREAMLPVRAVESVYNFDGVLDNLLLNPSFETEGDGGTGSAAYWPTSGADVFRVDLTSGAYPVPASWEDQWGLQIDSVTDAGGSATPHETEQSGAVFLPAAAGWALEFDYSLLLQAGIGGDIISAGGLTISIGGSYIKRTTGTVGAAAINGENVRILVEPLGDGLGGVEGTPLIPEGAGVAVFDSGGTYRTTITVTRTARVGEVYLFADVPVNLSSGDFFVYYYWGTSAEVIHGTGAFEGSTTFAGWGSFRFFATGVRPDGTLVSGGVSVKLVGPKMDFGTLAFAVYDDLRFTVTTDGVAPDVFTTLVHRGADAAGITEALPVGASEHPIGDGPLPDSETGLEVGAETTYQGADTGWKAGAYAPGEPTTGVGLEAFAATRALMQLGTGRQRIHATFDLSAGQRILPETVMLYWQRSTIVDLIVAGAEEVQVRAPVRAGQSLVLGVGTEREETVTVSAVAEGAHGTVCTIGATAHEHYVSEGCLYSGYYLPDEIAWALDTGEVSVSATELHLDDETYVTELRLGRADD